MCCTRVCWFDYVLYISLCRLCFGVFWLSVFASCSQLGFEPMGRALRALAWVDSPRLCGERLRLA